MERLPDNWRSFLGGRLDAAGLEATLAKVEAARAAGQVFPPAGQVFHALELTAPEEVKVVLLGQDPYHDDGQAEGLAFSVPNFRRACAISSRSMPPTSGGRCRRPER